jgi:hypothetical protein
MARKPKSAKPGRPPAAAALPSATAVETPTSPKSWARPLAITGLAICLYSVFSIDIPEVSRDVFTRTGTMTKDPYGNIVSDHTYLRKSVEVSRPAQSGIDLAGPFIPIAAVLALLVMATPLYRRPIIRKCAFYGAGAVLLLHLWVFSAGFYMLGVLLFAAAAYLDWSTPAAKTPAA